MRGYCLIQSVSVFKVSEILDSVQTSYPLDVTGRTDSFCKKARNGYQVLNVDSEVLYV